MSKSDYDYYCFLKFPEFFSAYSIFTLPNLLKTYLKFYLFVTLLLMISPDICRAMSFDETVLPKPEAAMKRVSQSVDWPGLSFIIVPLPLSTFLTFCELENS